MIDGTISQLQRPRNHPEYMTQLVDNIFKAEHIKWKPIRIRHRPQMPVEPALDEPAEHHKIVKEACSKDFPTEKSTECNKAEPVETENDLEMVLPEADFDAPPATRDVYCEVNLNCSGCKRSKKKRILLFRKYKRIATRVKKLLNKNKELKKKYNKLLKANDQENDEVDFGTEKDETESMLEPGEQNSEESDFGLSDESSGEREDGVIVLLSQFYWYFATAEKLHRQNPKSDFPEKS
eukprot:gene10112-18774_t